MKQMDIAGLKGTSLRRVEMKKRINFKDRIPNLSEEHIKQICRFTKTEMLKASGRGLGHMLPLNAGTTTR